jgi:hypothetical protein
VRVVIRSLPTAGAPPSAGLLGARFDRGGRFERGVLPGIGSPTPTSGSRVPQVSAPNSPVRRRIVCRAFMLPTANMPPISGRHDILSLDRHWPITTLIRKCDVTTSNVWFPSKLSQQGN